MIAAACAAGDGCDDGFTPYPQLTFQGDKINAAGAARLSAQGFDTLNAEAGQFLDFFAPGGVMEVPIGCTTQSVNLGPVSVLNLAIADTGTEGCDNETCGYMDGVCDAQDTGATVQIAVNSLRFEPAAPNLIKAIVNVSIDTGLLPISSVGNSALCLVGLPPTPGRVKLNLEYDTATEPPESNELSLDVALTIDSRWDQLLGFEVVGVGNTGACGNTPSLTCIDPDDMVITNVGCSALNIAQLGPVKTLLINLIASQLQSQLSGVMGDSLCAPCGPSGECPSFDGAVSACVDGVCRDTSNDRCVPLMLGIEGRVDVGPMLQAIGAPLETALEFSVHAGGNAEGNANGLSAGMRGGARALEVPLCVPTLQRPAPSLLPLPDFDLGAPGPYDVGLSLSQQLLTEVMFAAHQSGALCLQLGTDIVSVLDSSLLATLLPSLNTLTHGENVPLRLVVRPATPPTAVIGAGTFTATGEIDSPLLRLDWPGVDLDLYALIEGRYVRLLILKTDLSLPIGLQTDGCQTVTPVIGSLANVISNVEVTNTGLLLEDASVLASLVPTLLSLAGDGALTGALPGFTIPDIQGYAVRLLDARGIGPVAGTQTFRHAAIYAEIRNAGEECE